MLCSRATLPCLVADHCSAADSLRGSSRSSESAQLSFSSEPAPHLDSGRSRSRGTKAVHSPTSALCTILVPTSGYKGLDVWERLQSLGSLDGPTQPTRTLRWARRPAERGVRPPPDAWRSCRAARLTHARPLRTACLATPHQRARLYGRQASTLACGASSLWRAPTTRWRAIVTSYPGVLLRERTSGGGGAVARAHRLSCGRPRAAEGLEVGGWARLSAGLLGAF